MNLREFIDQLSNAFKSFSTIQKIAIIGATFAVIIAVLLLVLWANKPVYKTLYGNLDEKSRMQIEEYLQSNNIPYQLGDDGKTIAVPDDEVYSVRLELAKEGIPKVGGPGFELFDRSSFGMTEFMQDVNFQRALQGELSRTISNLESIESARVHLSIPKDRLFVTEDTEAKAAVVIDIADNAEITRDQIKSIAFLVSGSIKGLDPKNVQVVDTSGRLLSEFLTDENAPLMMTQTQLEYQRKVEDKLENKLYTLLSSTLGPGNAVAKVSVELNYDKKTVKSEHFDPNPVIRSRQSMEINSISTALAPQGIPGVEPNLAEPDLFEQNVKSEYNKTEDTYNYEVGRTVTEEKKAIGDIERLTVAVVVNDKKAIVEENGRRKLTYLPRDERELERIKDIVAMAVGYNENRGDKIEVANIPFNATDDFGDFYVEDKTKVHLISTVIKYSTALLLMLLFYLFVIRPILRRILAQPEEVGGLGGEGIDVTLGEEEFETPKTVGDVEKEIEDELDQRESDIETTEAKVMLKRLRESIDEDPTMIASLITAWLKE
ncbi:MAG: flagellar basal-body MS-ring/collar protein FliF [Deferribacterota bacterium]|nr:flagellar basal-body MS-ring/collar protein FliF [Deferribacterota bacterium]